MRWLCVSAWVCVVLGVSAVAFRERFCGLAQKRGKRDQVVGIKACTFLMGLDGRSCDLSLSLDQ